MRIAVIINHLGVGGAEHHVVDRINEMHRRGITVYLVTLAPEPEKSFIGKLRIPDSQRVMVRVASPWNLRQIVDLTHLLTRISPVLLAAHLCHAITVCRLASFFARVPRVISAEHNIVTEKSWKQKLVDVLLQFVSDSIVTDSETSRKSLLETGILPSRVKAIYVSINFKEFFTFSEIDMHQKYNIPKDQFIFLFAGSFTHQKNIFNIIRAFAKANRGFLVIAGDGKYRKELENLTVTLGIKNKVAFIGIVSDLADLMRISDAFLFPTRWEGLGLVVAEAILCNLPPIVSKYTACGEMVTDGFNGLTVDDPENVDEIARAIVRMVDDSILREKLKSNCGKLPFDLSIEHNVDEFLALLSGLI